MQTIAIAGSGFAGAVLARELADSKRYNVVVFEQRDHIAGNCYTERDPETNVMVHKYGPHIFHTAREDVWQYVNRFAEFMPYTNRVKAVTSKGVYGLPMNLLTINQFFGKTMNPKEAREFIANLGEKDIGEATSFEEQGLKFLGKELYEAFFRGYTRKQWGIDPTELPASILQRLPIRFDYNDNYFMDPYQGIPKEGYTALIEKMLDHPAITVNLCEAYVPEYKKEFAHVFFSGPMDAYYRYRLGRLNYRSLVFEKVVGEGDMQGNAVINYCEEEVPYTRISEHKHFAPWETHEKSVSFIEYSKATEPCDTPYYPLRLKDDKELLKAYQELAKEDDKLTFIGRLGTYRYLDMHLVIGESLDLAKTCLSSPEESWPRFSKEE